MKKNIFLLFTLLTITTYSQVLVKNIAPGLTSSYPHMFYPFRGNLIFAADDGFHGTQLYYSDGSQSGTVILTELYKTQGEKFDYNFGEIAGCFTEIDSLGYFFGIATNQTDFNLWKTDGTLKGTKILSKPLQMLDGSKFFKMQNKICALIRLYSTYNLLKYDPVSQNTSIIPITRASRVITDNYLFKTNGPGSGNNNYPIEVPYVYNDKIYSFTINGDSIFSTDINGISSFVAKSKVQYAYSQHSTIINNKLIFYPIYANPIPSTGIEPYYFDFTTNQFALLKDINPYFNFNSDVQFLPLPYLDSKKHTVRYFYGRNEDYGAELWVTDGTATGTFMVQDKTAGPVNGPYNFLSPANDICYNGDTIYIFAKDNSILLCTKNGISKVDSYLGYPMLNKMSQWNLRNSSYFLTDKGLILKTPGAFFPVDTLNPLSCSTPNIYKSWSGDGIGTLLKTGTNLFLSYNDCNFTGYELFKLNLNLSSIVESNFSKSVSVYPNPTNGKFKIETDDLMLTKAELEIYNVFGEKIYSTKINSSKTEIDLNKEANGMYFLQLKTEQGSAVKKIIVNH